MYRQLDEYIMFSHNMTIHTGCNNEQCKEVYEMRVCGRQNVSVVGLGCKIMWHT